MSSGYIGLIGFLASISQLEALIGDGGDTNRLKIQIESIVLPRNGVNYYEMMCRFAIVNFLNENDWVQWATKRRMAPNGPMGCKKQLDVFSKHILEGYLGGFRICGCSRSCGRIFSMLHPFV